MPNEQIAPKQSKQVTSALPVCSHGRSFRRIRRAQWQLRVGLIMGLVPQILVYLAGARMQDLLQHKSDRRFQWILAILDHIVGEAHP